MHRRQVEDDCGKRRAAPRTLAALRSGTQRELPALVVAISRQEICATVDKVLVRPIHMCEGRGC